MTVTHSETAVVFALLVSLGCNTAGRTSLSTGRGTYNAVINRTEDEQLLSMMVRQRYDETYGLLAVASVTANLRMGVFLGANVGIGSESSYAGNLVPFAAGATIEENPTISYVPMRGEQFVAKLLAPLTAEQTLLLGRMSSNQVETLRMFVRRANGLANPAYVPSRAGTDFERFIRAHASLRDEGVLDVVESADGEYELLIHDHGPRHVGDIAELLGVLGIPGAAPPGDDMRVPLRFFVGSARGEGLDLETPSALEVIQAAGEGIAVPEEPSRRASRDPRGSTRPATSSPCTPREGGPTTPLSQSSTATTGSTSTPRDAPSKQCFMILGTLIGLRLDDAGGQQTPVLTVPVGG